MRASTITGNKPERKWQTVRNDESSATLPKGEPCCFVMDGSEDGLAAVKAVTGTATKGTTLFAGIPNEDIIAGQIGEVQCYGIISGVKIIRRTRASSGSGTGDHAWPTASALALGDILNIETVNNGLTKSGAGAAAANLAFAVAAESAASLATTSHALAESTAAIFSLTVSTQAMKVFLRAM